MWLVLIEWDGKQPPTTYYSALHNLCLRVRGDKAFEPIVRRAGEYNKAVIVQEGAVLVPSESLARQVAHLAQTEGARSVMTGDVELNDDGTRELTRSEREVIQRFNDTFKKRGRPSAWDMEERDWVITCPECVHTSIATARKVIQCPRCGGLRVSARTGTRERIKPPNDFDQWKWSRFQTGQFEIPVYSLSGKDIAPVDFRQRAANDGNLMDKMCMDTLEKMDWAKHTNHYDLLDMVFCARRYYTYDDRKRYRADCCLKMYEQGFSQADVSLFEKDDIYEPIDAAIYYVGNYKDLIDIYKTM